ncbi:MAG: hypothetical protein K8E24_013130 [Methanobacterium paludis]|nr:hypothetical protein [Methanobacterium paludis]
MDENEFIKMCETDGVKKAISTLWHDETDNDFNILAKYGPNSPLPIIAMLFSWLFCFMNLSLTAQVLPLLVFIFGVISNYNRNKRLKKMCESL